jgi:hypothetical protein
MQGERFEFYGQPHSNVNDFNKKAMIAIYVNMIGNFKSSLRFWKKLQCKLIQQSVGCKL